MPNARKAAIVGGSIGGLFAAALLERIGWDVEVFERSRHGLRGRGAGLVPQRELFHALRRIGIEHVARMGVLAEERVTLARDGSLIDRARTPQSQMSWDTLYEALCAHAPAGRYHLGAPFASVEAHEDGVAVRLGNGTVVEADLLIGADGTGSAVREALAPGVSANYAGYAAWRGLVDETAMPKVAREALSGRFAFYRYPRSHILGYLMPGPDGTTEPGSRRYNWVWYRRILSGAPLEEALTDRDGVRHDRSLPQGGIRLEAREALRRDAEKLLPPPFASLVAETEEPFLQAIMDLETPVMAKGRVVLIGDAAFTVRPHTAMGTSKAADDAVSLADALAEGPDDLSAAIANWAGARMEFGRAVARHGRKLGASLQGAEEPVE